MKHDIEMDSLWKHKNGNRYEVIAVANEHAEGVKTKTFPVIVVYRSLDDGKIWARNIAYFNRVMTELTL